MKIKLKEQERIIRTIRQYGLTLWYHWFLGFLIISLAFFLIFWLFEHDWWGQSIFGLLVLSGFLIFLRTYYIWNSNYCTITTHRIIDSNQKGILEHELSEVSYEKIDDVFVSTKGFFPTLFKYGNLNIKTDEIDGFVIDKIKNPEQILQTVNEFRQRYLSKYSHDFEGDIAGIVMDKLYELELTDLVRVEKVLKKRIAKLSKKDD